MRVHTRVRLLSAIVAGLMVARCSSSTPSTPTLPTTTTIPVAPATPVTSFVTGVTAADGTPASQQAGAPPAASGGPTITATSNPTVINGGSDVARLQSASPFQTVYVSVGNTTGFSASNFHGLAAASGFYMLRLAAPTTDAFVTVALGRTLPANAFTLSYAAANAAGMVGATVNSTKAVNTSASTGDVQVSVSWNTPTDVDLHVVDPRGDEVYWNSTSVASGGILNLDSNANCAIDNKNNENIRWPAPAPTGTYTVRVDYWSACSVTGTTTYAVVVNNAGAQSVFNGSFTANQADQGARGSGRLITTFTRGSGFTTGGSSVVDRLLPSFTGSPEKQRLSGEFPRH